MEATAPGGHAPGGMRPGGREVSSLRAPSPIAEGHTYWAPLVSDGAGISYFFSFIPLHPFVRAQKKELHPINYFKKGCLAKKKFTTAHKAVGEIVPNRT